MPLSWLEIIMLGFLLDSGWGMGGDYSRSLMHKNEEVMLTTVGIHLMGVAALLLLA